jgi:uncharacterized Tic20 family protein
MTEWQPAPAARPLSPDDERAWSIVAHLGNVLGPVPSLLIMLLLGPRSTRVRVESREALNFSITATIVWVALWILAGVLRAVYDATPPGFNLGFGLLAFLLGFLQFVVWVVVVVLSIVAASRVNAGGTFRYPFTLRLVR